MPTIRELMDGVVQFITIEYKKVYNKNLTVQDGDPHHTICHATADMFNLYDAENMFPTWLSRVVEGIMEDVREEADLNDDTFEEDKS
jgi:hypothetical protein